MSEEARRVCCRITPRRQYGLFATGEYDLTLTPNAPTELPDLVLVRKPGGLPLDPEDGEVVTALVKGYSCAPDRPLVLPLRPLADFSTHEARLFCANESDCAWLELITSS
jgi:hypothetical protein